MPNYDFSVLDDYEFENLCKDLFNEEQRLFIKSNNGLTGNKIISFQSFKRGKDRGVDLYYKDDDDKVIGQVKLSRGKFVDVFNGLKKRINGKSEIDKVRILDPSKYIFFTSVPLSLDDKLKLINLFSPYIKSDRDIYGREDLNTLISSLEHVEKRHLKLYLNNPLVLERLLNSATFERSSFSLGIIQDSLKYFVQSGTFLNSLSILNTEHLLMIKGLPGVGKTTLAKMLSLHYVEKGYTFIEILDLDNELERLILREENLILYYDDFLGSNSYSVAEALRHESRLSNLLKQIILSRNKCLILTTRTNVLSNAEQKSEKLRAIFSTISKYEVDLTNLTDTEKKQILLKHIERNNLNINNFLPFIDKIIDHQNFNPRLIEFITYNVSNRKDEFNIKEFIFKVLDKPEEIWNFAYHEQTDFSSKIYLNHLFMFGNSCEAETFEKSFKKRIEFETITNNYISSLNEFRVCTNLMDSFFITINNHDYNGHFSSIDFINPSFVDYLLSEIRTNKEFIISSVKSFDAIEILSVRFNHIEKELLKILSISELKALLLNLNSFRQLEDEESKIEFLNICSMYFSSFEISETFLDEIKSIIQHQPSNEETSLYLTFANKFYEISAVKSHIDLHFNTIVTEILEQTKYKETFDDLITLFKKFHKDISTFTSLNDNERLFYLTLKNVLDEEIENSIIFRSERIKSFGDVENFYQEIKIEYGPYLKRLNAPADLLERILDGKDWDNIVNYYKFKNNGLVD